MTRDIGDKLAPKLVRLIADTVIATKKGLFPVEHKLRVKATQDIIDRAGREVAGLMQPHILQVLESPDLSPETRAVLESAASGEHQWQALAGFALSFTGAGATISTVINNDLAPTLRSIIARSPGQIPDAATLATMVAKAVIPESNGRRNIAEAGFDDYWATQLIRLAETIPPPDNLFSLLNRGIIPEQQVHDLLARYGIPPSLIDAIAHLSDQLLAPADAALAVLRGNMSHAEGVKIAKENGVSAADFEVLIGNTGEPPGVMDLLSAFRRGFIDQAELTHGILQSRVRNEWIPTILKMRFQPMTTADAIDATVQNHLSEAEARHIAEQNGLEPSAFDPLRLTAGSPLSKVEMLRLHRMGKATVDEVKQALRESRLKDKYIDHALELTTQIPPLFTIRSMLSAGAITDAEAATLLHEDGYQEFVIKAVIKSSHKTKTAKARDLTEGMLSELYQEQAIPAQQFTDHLEHMGYSKAEAAEIREIDDWKIAKANRDNAISKVRAGYVGRKIPEHVASGELDALQVPSNMRDKLLADWDIEIQSTVHLLTGAQIVAAWYIQLFTTEQALAKLVHIGYSAADARTLLEIRNKGPLA